MTGLELVGASALYLLGLVVTVYLVLGIVGFWKRKSGLEGIAAIVFWCGLTMIAGVLLGMFLLGRALA